jgi:hypothetical protein
MDIADVIKELGQAMGLPLKLDRNRACRLVFDGKIEVDIEAPADGGGIVFLHTAVGTVPSGGREALYQSLLEANLFGRGTGGGVLAVDPEFNEIMLTRTLAMDRIFYQDFVKEPEQHVLHANTWLDRLATHAHGNPEAADDPGAASASTLLRI